MATHKPGAAIRQQVDQAFLLTLDLVALNISGAIFPEYASYT